MDTEAATNRRLRLVGVLAIAAAFAVPGCGHEFDTTRTAPERGTLGEEIYKVLCQRLAAEEVPSDVTGNETRALCEGRVGPAAAPGPRLRALAENRERLVLALDRTLPESLEDDLDHFLVQLLPFYDPPEERLPSQTRATADFLERLMHDDEAVAAFERIGTRDGYRPLRVALGLVRPVLAYPRFDEFVTKALDTIDRDGSAGEEWEVLLRAAALDMATARPDPSDGGPSTLALTRQLMLTQRDAFGSGGSRFMTVRDGRGIARVATSGGTVRSPFVDDDGDGLADVDSLGRYVDGTGSPLDVPSPFPVAGEMDVTRDAVGRALGSSRDPLYEYLDVNRTLVAGLTREMPELVAPEAPTLLDLGYGLPALMGPETTQSRELGAATFEYSGYDTSQGPLFDLVHAMGSVLHRPQTEDALAVAETLLRDYEHETAGLIDSGLHVDAVADDVPDDVAYLEPESELWDDQIRIATWIAQEPGLMEALLRAFADPRTARLGQIYSEMMRHKDEVRHNTGSLEQINEPLRDIVFREPVDRDMPNVGSNHSIFQRSISAIHDLEGVRLCNKDGASLRLTSWLSIGNFDECELLEIDNVAQEYAKAIIGRAELVLKPRLLNALLEVGESLGISTDAVLERLSGIDGLTTSPTPEALNRLVFARDDLPTANREFVNGLIDPPETRDGALFEERHAAAPVYTWEREYVFCDDVLITPGEAADGACSPEDIERYTFYDAMTPLLEAFDDYDRGTEGRFLFGRLISATHLHWATPEDDKTQSDDPSAPFFSWQSGGARYEPIVADGFADCMQRMGNRCTVRGGKLLTRIHELAVALDELEIREGVDGIDALADANNVLLDPERNPGLMDRRGFTEARTNAGTRTPAMTPMYLILDSLNGIDDAFDAAEPVRHEHWLEGRGQLVDQLLSADCSAGSCRIDNRRAHASLLVITEFLQDRIAAHRSAGDVEEWAAGLDDRVESSIASPLTTAILRFVDAVQRDPEAREELSKLTAYLADEGSENDAFPTMVTAIADMLQFLEDEKNTVPIFQGLSRALAINAPEAVESGEPLQIQGTAVDETMDLIREINEVDDRRTLKEILANLVALPGGGLEETPLEVLIDVIVEVHRASPGEGTRLRAEDYREVFGRTVDFLTNEDRGLERLYRVVQCREIQPPGSAAGPMCEGTSTEE